LACIAGMAGGRFRRCQVGLRAKDRENLMGVALVGGGNRRGGAVARWFEAGSSGDLLPGRDQDRARFLPRVRAEADGV